MLVKRILALPGDKVQTLPPYPDQIVTVPPGHAWVEGMLEQWLISPAYHSQVMINGAQETATTSDL
jgi:hypothetical protein